jgi:hypothetical protein
MTRTAKKTTLPTILRCRGTSLPNYLPNNGSGIHRPSFDKTRSALKTMRPTILLLIRLVAAAGTRSPSRCLAPKGRIHLTEPLSCHNRIHADTHRLMGGVYEIRRWDWLGCRHTRTKFHKDSFSHSEVYGGRYTDAHTGWRLHTPNLGK